MGTHVCLVLFISLVCSFGYALGLSCKDENNKDVDWFLNYKLPTIESDHAESDLRHGKAYAYLTSDKHTDWTLSSTSVQSEDSMLGKTWHDFAASNMENDRTSYLFYNDDAPEMYGSSSIGHLKGIVAFDDHTGFWLVHSIPNFGEPHKYEYPETGLLNGQTAFCVTFNVSNLNTICHHLLYCNPNIYEKQLTEHVSKYLDGKAKSIFTDRPAFIRKPPFVKSAHLKSLGNQDFLTFAKDNQKREDIYSSIIAPNLDSSLFAETWRRGSGGVLLSTCKTDYSVVDITAIRMKPSNAKKDIAFRSSEDHSKWAISDEAAHGFICIGDLNRMKSQERRGGGAICFKSAHAWKAYESIIHESNLCPTK